MTTTPLLVPYLALQLAFWVRAYDRLAFRPKCFRLLEHPRVSQCMFARPNRTVTDVFGEVFGMGEDLRFRNLREGSCRIVPGRENTSRHTRDLNNASPVPTNQSVARGVLCTRQM